MPVSTSQEDDVNELVTEEAASGRNSRKRKQNEALKALDKMMEKYRSQIGQLSKNFSLRDELKPDKIKHSIYSAPYTLPEP